MRILFVTSKLDFETAGGSVPDLNLKVRTLQEFGHEVAVLTVFSERNKISEKPPYRVIEYMLPATDRLVAVQKKIRRLLREQETSFDVFHVEGQFTYGAGLYRALSRVPVVVFCNREMPIWAPVHGFFPSFKRATRLLLEKTFGAWLAQHVDHYVFTNPNLAAEYRAFGYRAPYTIMTDFVDPEEKRKRINVAAPDPASRAAEKDTCTLFASGRMIRGKGFHVIIEALALLHDSSKVSVILSGDGPERQRLEALAKERGVAERIDFPGWVAQEEMLRTLAAADLFILPQWRSDLTSVILVEALVFATPCIVPADTGLAWVAGAGALHFTEGDAADLARVIEKIIGSPDLRVQLSAGALARLTEIDYRVMGRTLEGILFSLTQQA